MEDLTSQSWFWWGLVLILGVPLAVLLLSELQSALVKRDSALARPVGLLRTAVVLGALLLLLTRAAQVGDSNWVRVIATIFGFLLILLVLSVIKAVMFVNAQEGTWRQRLPSIFIDLARLVLIGVGLAMLFSWVWGANVGGLVAALGVTSIVLGLALQNAVGGIISGLLLLFEQPFTLGDWLTVGTVSGRVVEVNWRAVHIDTGNAIHVVPNAALAGSQFVNLSRPTRDYVATVETSFAVDDPPHEVARVLDEVGLEIALLKAGSSPRTRPAGDAKYVTSLPIETYADTGAATTAFLTRAWYATRRAGPHLDGADPEAGLGPDRVEAALRRVAATLHVTEDEVAALAPEMGLEQYGDGELVQRQGSMPDALRFLVGGRVELIVRTPDGSVRVGSHEAGDYVGQSVLTREPAIVSAVATGVVTVLRVPVAVVDNLVTTRPRLARELGEVTETRRRLAAEARAV